MHCQLQKPVASYRLRNHSEVLRVRRRSCQRLRIEARERIKASVQLEVAVWRIETGLVEDVEGIRLEFQRDPLRDLKVLENREIETRLERRTEYIAPGSTVAGFKGIASGRSRRSGTAGWNTTLAGT